MSEDNYVAVDEKEMSLELYPCGLKAGSYIVPQADITGTDEDGNEYLYLKQGQRCLVLTGNPRESDIIWFRICATGEVGTWDETIMEAFAKAPPKMVIHTNDLQGKNLLIGINRYDAENNWLGGESHFGKVVEVTDQLISIQDQESQDEFSIPFDLNAIEESDPDLIFTFNGVSVSGVNFISHWTVSSPPQE